MVASFEVDLAESVCRKMYYAVLQCPYIRLRGFFDQPALGGRLKMYGTHFHLKQTDYQYLA